MRKKAPVQLTGGAGFHYENPVAARFLLDLLAGSNALGVDFGRIVRLDWQARDSGWLADDLVVTCKHSSGDRAAGISIKSAQQVTRAGFPQDFVETAWAQWLGIKTDRKLRDSSDAIVLVTGSLAHDVEDAWSNLLFEALKTTPDRMLKRLTEPVAGEGSQSSALERALFESFRCPEELRGSGDTGDAATIQLLSRVRLLHFDFEATPSRDHVQALADCQSVLRSGDASEAENLWRCLNSIADDYRPAGGFLDLPRLLAQLRGEFDLRDHPNYRRDWEVLHRSSQELMADVRTQIADLAPLARVDERATIEGCLNTQRACLIVGESGCGKSALAKEIAQASYQRVVWIAETTLDYDTAGQFERGINIGHPLAEVLTALPTSCLVVFDGIERYPPRALRLACRIMQELLVEAGPEHVHVLVTAQFEAANRLIRSFVEFGVPRSLHEATPIRRPSEDDVENLVVSIAELRWASLRPELRPLLTNLKVLDWVVAAARSGTIISDSSFIGLTDLIDALWERWVQGDTDGLGRSHVLMHVGMLEGDTLSSGVPRMQLEHAEQAALATLAMSNLVRIRDERVRFSHDLLGDWARMRILVGEPTLSSPQNRERADLPRWHRAVRLFGQRLLEQSADGAARWQQVVEALDDETQSGAVIRDLFLESLFLATNAAALLQRSWPALSARGGRLLNRMLDRFLFVATLPDPRIAALTEGGADGAQWQHLFRIPYWPYWAPVLMVLHAHRADVVQLAPHTVAKICSLWLRIMPTELSPGQPTPWRPEAAELAVAIGREIEARNAEGNYFSDRQDKFAYEAVLWAAPELPDEVAALCLELAERRDLAPEIRARVDQAHERMRAERRQWLAANPDRALAPPPIPSIHGPLRDPWPDGPRARVDTDFQEACLDTAAFSALVRPRPDVAQEVLLAVCIEEPQYDDYSWRSRRECGLEGWHSSDPPLYCRGPFLPFLRQAPEHGLSFVLKLINFATRRYAVDDGLSVTLGDSSRTWFGDANVFLWHFDWPVSNGSAIHCSLMALERWLYEQIERGENIDPWIARILAESESLAFAGLLFDVGKRHPPLFAGVLKPLLRNWVLIDWDRQAATLRQPRTDPMGYWGHQPAAMIELGRAWFAMPHRRNLLAYLGGAVVETMIGDEEQWPFFEQLRGEWAAQLDTQGRPKTLRLLIERFNPANYTFEVRDGKRVPVDFQWPDILARQNAQEQQKIGQHSAVTRFPWLCRQRLNAGSPPPHEQIPAFWEFIQGIDTNPPELARENGEPLLHIEDVLCAGIAVLVVLHYDWLTGDPDRMAWCRRKLEAILQNPPVPFQFDSEIASGERQWDAFAAEAGVALLARNRNDALARLVVATGIVSFHYSTTALTAWRASLRLEQIGDDFDRMLGLAARWAGLRTPYALATRPHFDTQRDTWHARKKALIHEFVDRRLPVEFPDIREINATAAAEFDAVHAQLFPESASMRATTRRSRRRGRHRESLSPEPLRLDSHVISSAFAWLDLPAGIADADRRRRIGFVRGFLDIVLSSIPTIDDPGQQKIDGLPSGFDDWVFGRVAAAIPRLTAAEGPRSLWQPLLDLGSPAHEWVERFFWYWFTDGLRAAETPDDFTRLWSAMIQYALESSGWDPSANQSYDLDGMVFQLLGCDSRMNKLGLNPALTSAVAPMESVFAAAAQRWFGMPKVVTGFLYSVVQPAMAPLLLPSVLTHL